MYSFLPVNSGAMTQESAYTYAPVQNNAVAYTQQMCGNNMPVRMIYVGAQPTVASDSVPMVYWNNNTNNMVLQPTPQQNQQMFIQPVQNNQKNHQQQQPQIQYVQIIPSSFHPNQTVQTAPQYPASHQLQSIALDGAVLQGGGQFNQPQQRMDSAVVPSLFYLQAQQYPSQKMPQALHKASERQATQPSFIQKSQQHASQKMVVPVGGASKKIIRPPSTTWGFMLLDPINKVNPILNVHFDFVYPTAATESYYTDAHQGSMNYRMHHKVCPRFTGGDEDAESGCPMGKQCQYMHIHPTFLRATRCVTQPLCCAEHNCYFTRHTLQKAQKVAERKNQEPDACDELDAEEMSSLSAITVLTVWSHGRCIGTIQPSKLSLTVACRRLETCPHIDLDRAACRLYQQGRCRWGKECAHFHLCRELYAQWVDAKVLQLTMECMPELVVTSVPTNDQIKHDADADADAQELIITEMLNGLSIGQKTHESTFDPMVSPCTPSIATPTTRSPAMGSIEIGDVVLSQENTKCQTKGFELSEHEFAVNYLLKDTKDDNHSDGELNTKNFVATHAWKLPADSSIHSQQQSNYAMFSSDLVPASHAPLFVSPPFITPSCLDEWKMN